MLAKKRKTRACKNWGDANDYCANLNLGKKMTGDFQK